MILVTGSTGFLGHQLLGRLLLTFPQQRFAVIVRPSAGRSGAQRLKLNLEHDLGKQLSDANFGRIEIYEGDVTLEYFGLSPSIFHSLATRVQSVYHSAASTALNQSLASARAINVAGTEQVIRFTKLASKQGAKCKLFHISTAYVAGDTDQIVLPSELKLDRPFRNGYEQSKAEAEALVRASSDQIDTCIFRPSIIVGDSVTGQTSAFNVLYVPAKFLSKGLFRAVPASPNIPFDIVPVDYVADAMIAISSNPNLAHGCYHLSAGVGRESSPLEILDLLIKTVNEYRCGVKRLKKLPFVPMDEILALAQLSLSAARFSVKNLEDFFSKRIEIIRQTLPFIPYLTHNPQFDASETKRVLEGILLPPPLFRHYAESLFHYCLETNWGKTPWTNPNQQPTWSQRATSLPASG